MKRLGSLLLGTTMLVAACGDNGTSTGATEAQLRVAFTDLPTLGPDFVYENWLITSAGAEPAGRFTVDADGELSESVFPLADSVADDSSTFVLTIEPATGDDPGPSDTHVLAGDIVDNDASLRIDHPAALADDFTSATGEYILAAPTGGPDAPFQNGIWFLIPGEAPTAGFSLPDLPAGWVYEGWVVDSDGPISIGRFLDPSAPDSDGPGLTAGSEDAPPFPGQDFLTPPEEARDLSSGHTAVLSIEPDPDDSPAPFILKPLVHEIGAVAPPDTQTMDNNAVATSPTGSATITR